MNIEQALQAARERVWLAIAEYVSTEEHDDALQDEVTAALDANDALVAAVKAVEVLRAMPCEERYVRGHPLQPTCWDGTDERPPLRQSQWCRRCVRLNRAVAEVDRLVAALTEGEERTMTEEERMHKRGGA